MSALRRVLFVAALTTFGCDAGPTSDWPGETQDKGDDDMDEDLPPRPNRDGGVSLNMDASTPSTSIDGGGKAGCADAGDAGDASDAGCR